MKTSQDILISCMVPRPVLAGEKMARDTGINTKLPCMIVVHGQCLTTADRATADWALPNQTDTQGNHAFD